MVAEIFRSPFNSFCGSTVIWALRPLRYHHIFTVDVNESIWKRITSESTVNVVPENIILPSTTMFPGTCESSVEEGYWNDIGRIESIYFICICFIPLFMGEKSHLYYRQIALMNVGCENILYTRWSKKTCRVSIRKFFLVSHCRSNTPIELCNDPLV